MGASTGSSFCISEKRRDFHNVYLRQRRTKGTSGGPPRIPALDECHAEAPSPYKSLTRENFKHVNASARRQHHFASKPFNTNISHRRGYLPLPLTISPSRSQIQLKVHRTQSPIPGRYIIVANCCRSL